MRGFLFMPSTHTKCKGRRETFARLVKSIPFPKRIVHDDQAGEEETKKRCGFEEPIHEIVYAPLWCYKMTIAISQRCIFIACVGGLVLKEMPHRITIQVFDR